jgi:hypothetical protein
MRATFALLALTAFCVTGCSIEQAYYTAQGWQRNQCNKIPDKADFDRCMSQSQTSYESYEQQTRQNRKQ